MNKQYKLELHGKDLKTGETQILKYDTIHTYEEMLIQKQKLQKIVDEVFTSRERVKIVIIELGGGK